MGLSNEERLNKFYNGMVGLRKDLVELREILESDRHAKFPNRGMIDEMVAEVDLLVGMMISHSDTNTAYWLVGPNEGNYESLVSNHEGVALVREDFPSKREGGTLAWYLDEVATLPYAARKFTEGDFAGWDHEAAAALAKWWDAWSWFGFLLYAVMRYEDRLFPEGLRERLMRLMGRMANTRHAVIFPYQDRASSAHFEQALFSRHQVVRGMMEKERGRIGHDEASKAQFDGDAVYKKVGAMTLAEVEEWLKKDKQEEYERRGKEGEKTPLKPDGIMGPATPTSEELHKILETSQSLEECEKASKQLEHCYSSYWGGWRERFKPRKEFPGTRAAWSKVLKEARGLLRSGSSVEAIRVQAGEGGISAKLEVIRALRNQYELGLKEAKDLLDAALADGSLVYQPATPRDADGVGVADNVRLGIKTKGRKPVSVPRKKETDELDF